MEERITGEQEELPCIWVSAGVLSYRLCDRNYDCEGCELYHALRGRPGGRNEPGQLYSDRRDSLRSSPTERVVDEMVTSYLYRLGSGCELHLDWPYSASHFWLHQLEDGNIAIGLDCNLLRMLFPSDDITLPHVGVLTRRGEPCGWITRGRLAVPLTAPISGTVGAVNDAYVERLKEPRPVCGSGEWLLNLTPDEALADVPGLYRSEDTLVWYLRKIQLVKHHLRAALNAADVQALGVTLADGGELNWDLEEVLGRDRFEALVDDLFHLQI
jgi:glycine cleavage system H lipoate-binding protein